MPHPNSTQQSLQLHKQHFAVRFPISLESQLTDNPLRILISIESTESLIPHQLRDTIRVLKRRKQGELASVRF